MAGYRCKLLAMGYAPETARRLLKVLGQLGRWMTANDVAVSQLDWETITRFLAYRSSDSFRQTPHRRGLHLLLELLVEECIVEAVDPAPLSELEALLRDYRASTSLRDISGGIAVSCHPATGGMDSLSNVAVDRRTYK